MKYNIIMRLFLFLFTPILILSVFESKASGWCQEGYVSATFSEITKFAFTTMGAVTIVHSGGRITIDGLERFYLDKKGICVKVGDTVKISSSSTEKDVTYTHAPTRYIDQGTYQISENGNTRQINVKRKATIQPAPKRNVKIKNCSKEASFSFADTDEKYMYVLSMSFEHSAKEIRHVTGYLERKSLPTSAEEIGITPIGSHLAGGDCCKSFFAMLCCGCCKNNSSTSFAEV